MKRTPSHLSWILLGLVGLSAAILLWDKAFPGAALDFKLTRRDAETQMRQWLESQGVRVNGHHHAILFGETAETKNYLELEQGLPTLNRLVKEGVNIWYWYGRWFKPEQEEEFAVSVDPQGRLVLFLHTIEEARAAPFLPQEQARALAEKFLRMQVTQHPFNRLRFISGNAEQKPARMDYSFTWERDELRVGTAPYRLEVTIQGDRVGAYTEELKIPEAWSRDFSRRQELNQFCVTNADYARYLLRAAALLLFMIYAHQKRLDWKRALPWGWLVLFGIVFLADGINNIPALTAQYPTADKWGPYLLREANSLLQQGLFEISMLWLVVVVGDPLYRRHLPQHLPLSTILGAASLRHRETLRSIGLGTVFACVGLGYVCIFYVVGKPLGVWSPVEIDSSKALSGWLPWIEPLHVGLSAAFSEEMEFRVLAILILQMVFGSRRLAVVLSAAIWAFLHSDYPQMPGYIRGIELTVEGSLWGMLMLRFGILTPLVAHYLYDCWLGSYIVLFSPSWSDRVGAILVSFWPIGLGLWGWWRNARQTDRPSAPARPKLSGKAGPGSSVPPWWGPTLNPWNTTLPLPSTNQALLLLLTGLLFQIFSFLVPLPQESLARLGRVDLSRAQIEQEAARLLRQHHTDPASLHVVTTLTASSAPMKYLLEYGSLDQVAGFFETEWPDLRWNVRFFQFGEKEEFLIQLDQHGRWITWSHAVPREAEGASLDQEAALLLAQERLRKTHAVDFNRETLTQHFMEQQEKRRDYSFTFERKNWRWGDSKLRTGITVQGDETMHFNRYVHVPEAWIRMQSGAGWKDAITHIFSSWLFFGRLAVAVALFLIMIYPITDSAPWEFRPDRKTPASIRTDDFPTAGRSPPDGSPATVTTRLSRWKTALLHRGRRLLEMVRLTIRILKHVLPWKAGFFAALLPSGISVIIWLNGLPWFFSNYDTSQPVSYYFNTRLGGVLVDTTLGYLWNGLMAAFILRLVQWAFGWRWKPRLLWPHSAETRRRIWFSAVALGLLGAVIWQAEIWLESLVSGWLLPHRTAAILFPNVNVALPWLASLCSAAYGGYHRLLGFALRIAIAVVLYRRFPKSVWLLVFLMPFQSAIHAETWSEFAYLAVFGELGWLLNLALLWRVWRFNVLAIFLATVFSTLLASIQLFVSKGGPVYQWQALPLLLVFLIPCCVAFWPVSKRSSKTVPEQGPAGK